MIDNSKEVAAAAVSILNQNAIPDLNDPKVLPKIEVREQSALDAGQAARATAMFNLTGLLSKVVEIMNTLNFEFISYQRGDQKDIEIAKRSMEVTDQWKISIKVLRGHMREVMALLEAQTAQKVNVIAMLNDAKRMMPDIDKTAIAAKHLNDQLDRLAEHKKSGLLEALKTL